MHESAHKLHFYNNGQYSLKPIVATAFESKWKPTLSNLNLCKYLPLNLAKNVSWSDGSYDSRCGFARSYGAYKTEQGMFYEDVATFTEDKAFGKTSYPKDGFSNIYPKKINILNEYDF